MTIISVADQYPALSIAENPGGVAELLFDRGDHERRDDGNRHPVLEVGSAAVRKVKTRRRRNAG